jgi:uncharacterized protein (TIGR02266 family)
MTQDTRKDRRAKIVSLNVRYKSATVDEFIENHSHDVSRGGIFIKTPSPFPPGTLLKFEIRIAGDKAVIAGVGRVVWKREAAQTAGNTDQPAGMGVKFIKLDDASRAVIDRLVNAKGDVAGAFDNGPVEGSPAPFAAPAAPVAKAPPSGPALDPPAQAAGAERAAPASPFQPSPSAQGMPAALQRKATIMGLGSSPSSPAPAPRPAAPIPAAGSPPRPGVPEAPGSRPSLGGAGAQAKAPPAASSPFSSGTAASSTSASPAKAAAGSPMFPKTNSQAEMPPQGEQTVMKQAAELLEEALRGAGGSMDEIGQNPLFEQAAKAGIVKPAPVADREAPVESPRPAPGRGASTAASPPGRASAVSEPPVSRPQAAAPVSVRGAGAGRAEVVRDVPLSKAPVSVRQRAVSEPPPPPARSKALFPVLVIGAVGALAYFAYTQMFIQPPAATPIDTNQPPVPPAPSASTPPSASASSSAPLPAATNLGAGDAAAADVDAANTASTDAGGLKSASEAGLGTAPTTTTAVSQTAVRPTVPTASQATTGGVSATPPPPRPPPPRPPPRPKPAEDDNPY